MRRPSDHIESSVFQSVLDGELKGGPLRDLEGHLAGCPGCAAEYGSWRALSRDLEGLPRIAPSPALAERVLDATADWRALLGRLDRIPRLEPSEGFPDRVMVAFRNRRGAVAPSAAAGRLDRFGRTVHGTIRGWIPSTRRRRVLAGAVVAAPGVGIAALLAAVAAHPLLSPGDLVTVAGWLASDAVARGTELLTRLATSSPFSAEAGSLALAVLGSPGTAVSVLGAAWLTTFAAGWVLYRNVFPSARSRSRVAS